MFLCPSVRGFVLVCVCPDVMCACCLWYALTDFHQTFDSSAASNRDEMVRLWGQKVKGQGHSMTKYAKNTIFRVCFHDICGTR